MLGRGCSANSLLGLAESEWADNLKITVQRSSSALLHAATPQDPTVSHQGDDPLGQDGPCDSKKLLIVGACPFEEFSLARRLLNLGVADAAELCRDMAM